MQGAHPVIYVGKKVKFILNEVIHTAGKVIHRRIDKGDNQYFLVGIYPSVCDDFCCQVGKRMCFPAARNGGNTHFPTGVLEDFRLHGPRLKHLKSPPNPAWILTKKIWRESDRRVVHCPVRPCPLHRHKCAGCSGGSARKSTDPTTVGCNHVRVGRSTFDYWTNFG